MKKVFLTLTFVCAFVLGTIANPVETVNSVNNEVVTIYPDADGRYSYSGEIIWEGSTGYTMFNYVGEPNAYLQIREIENNYVSVNVIGNTVTITVDKNGWMEYGSPSPITFSLFYGYTTWGSVSLTVPPIY